MIEEQMLTFQLDVDVETRGQGVKIWEWTSWNMEPV